MGGGGGVWTVINGTFAHFSLGFLFCLLTAHLLRLSSETEKGYLSVLRQQSRVLLFIGCAGLSPHSPLNQRGLCYFQMLQCCDVTGWRKKRGVKKKGVLFGSILALLDLNCGWKNWDLAWYWKLRSGNRVWSWGVLSSNEEKGEWEWFFSWESKAIHQLGWDKDKLGETVCIMEWVLNLGQKDWIVNPKSAAN